MRRFYFPALAAPDAGPSDQSPLVLTGPEARHLALVLRLKAGDTVEFFDGLGQIVQEHYAHLHGPRLPAADDPHRPRPGRPLRRARGHCRVLF